MYAGSVHTHEHPNVGELLDSYKTCQSVMLISQSGEPFGQR